jgi:hypothetical protein
MPDKNKTDQWDKTSRNESKRNYVLGEHMSNPWNNTNNPNWRNEMLDTGYRFSMLNDPQRVEPNNRVEDNNSNKELLDDYPINPS